MQTLDPSETGGAETPLKAEGIGGDRIKGEMGAPDAWHAAQFGEAAAQRRAKRLALLLMTLSAAIMIGAAVAVWLTFFS